MSLKLTTISIFPPGKRHFPYINPTPSLKRVPDLFKEKLQITIFKKNEGRRRLGREVFNYFYAKIKLLIGFRGQAKLSISGALGLVDTFSNRLFEVQILLATSEFALPFHHFSKKFSVLNTFKIQCRMNK